MKTTGYALREAIKRHELRRDSAARSFTGTLKMFPGEEKESPEEVMRAFVEADEAIARLQEAQMRYNLAVRVPSESGAMPMSLALAVKLVGGAGRREKMWRNAGAPAERRGYGLDEDERDPTKVRASAVLSPRDLLKLSATASSQASALRQAIAVGNAVEVEIENLSASLFE
jgi:hypothetical protein